MYSYGFKTVFHLFIRGASVKKPLIQGPAVARHRSKNGESPTAVRWAHRLCTVLPSSFFDFEFLATPSWSLMVAAKQAFGGQRCTGKTTNVESI